MWQRLHEHCRSLVGGPGPERDLARAALDDEGFLTAACRQAVLAGAGAEEALASCHTLLGMPEAQGLRDRFGVPGRIALAGLANVVCRAGTEGVPPAAFRAPPRRSSTGTR